MAAASTPVPYGCKEVFAGILVSWPQGRVVLVERELGSVRGLTRPSAVRRASAPARQAPPRHGGSGRDRPCDLGRLADLVCRSQHVCDERIHVLLARAGVDEASAQRE